MYSALGVITNHSSLSNMISRQIEETSKESDCYKLNVSLQNSYVKILTPNVTVLGSVGSLRGD